MLLQDTVEIATALRLAHNRALRIGDAMRPIHTIRPLDRAAIPLTTVQSILRGHGLRIIKTICDDRGMFLLTAGKTARSLTVSHHIMPDGDLHSYSAFGGTPAGC